MKNPLIILLIVIALIVILPAGPILLGLLVGYFIFKWLRTRQSKR